MSRILLYGSGEKKSFLFFCMVSLQTCMCLHSEKPADGLKTGRRSVTSTAVRAVWVAEPLPNISGKKVTVIPPPHLSQRLRLPRTCAAERQSGRRDRLPLCGGSGGTHTLRGRVTDRLEPPPPPSENSRSQRRGRGRDRKKTRHNSWS